MSEHLDDLLAELLSELTDDDSDSFCEHGQPRHLLCLPCEEG